MGVEKYDPKLTLSYLAIISQIIQDYTMLKSPSDILTRFGNDYVIDVTDTSEREPLKLIQPLPEDFQERAFQRAPPAAPPARRASPLRVVLARLSHGAPRQESGPVKA